MAKPSTVFVCSNCGNESSMNGILVMKKKLI